MSGRQRDTAPDALGFLRVPCRLGPLRLHTEPGQQRPAPALVRGRLNQIAVATGQAALAATAIHNMLP